MPGSLLCRAFLEYALSNFEFQLNKMRRQRRSPDSLKESHSCLKLHHIFLHLICFHSFFPNILICMSRAEFLHPYLFIEFLFWLFLLQLKQFRYTHAQLNSKTIQKYRKRKYNFPIPFSKAGESTLEAIKI